MVGKKIKMQFLISFVCHFIAIRSRKFNVYYESRWDPLVFNKDVVSTDRLDIIRSQSGHYELHEYENTPDSFRKFGDISIISLNLFREVIYDLETIESAENVRTILDETHASVFALQGIDDTLLARIHGKIRKQNHYDMINVDKYDLDALSGQRTYLPIIYDTKLLHVVNTGYFETNNDQKMLYGSFAEFMDLRIPEAPVAFTVVNIDIFSSFNDIVSAQFSNIVQDVASFPAVANAAVIVAGSLGVTPPNVKDLMLKSYKNTTAQDKNNQNIPLTTLHSGNQDDGIQRDYILLRDEKRSLILNYSRILRMFKAGDRYPIHAIFSYNDDKFSMRKKRERDQNESETAEDENRINKQLEEEKNKRKKAHKEDKSLKEKALESEKAKLEKNKDRSPDDQKKLEKRRQDNAESEADKFRKEMEENTNKKREQDEEYARQKRSNEVQDNDRNNNEIKKNADEKKKAKQWLDDKKRAQRSKGV
ncbi:hypothetical protein EDEG_00635 [Edhazardia aedis USNM 41457]|uniref:Uncharacterized protein n=1 Tax=Edhazardia aedis (strain USNM 41457) TaxID=1003232 RepID=J9DVL6_EDHAE|nr:hypothetical protein EDEG_00635 [Edhazardia aedis USNM 41457]|eukprot:EJW05332.1 hypothetical protein EDEG_00635 [Edhazardia aedis USNM 41457]